MTESDVTSSFFSHTCRTPYVESPAEYRRIWHLTLISKFRYCPLFHVLMLGL
jgi:hypothetical protein